MGEIHLNRIPFVSNNLIPLPLFSIRLKNKEKKKKKRKDVTPFDFKYPSEM